MEKELLIELRSVLMPFGDHDAVDKNGYVKRKLLLRYFHVCHWHRELILVLVSGTIENTFRDDFTNIVAESLSEPFSRNEWTIPEYKPYMLRLTADIILSMLIQWLKNDDLDYDEFMFFYEEIFRSNYNMTRETMNLKSPTKKDR